MSHSFPGPEDISRVELPNGIVVLSRANYLSSTVVINGFLPVGGLFDPDGLLGLSDFTSAALLRGVERRNFQQIFDALESAGASLRFSGGTHTTGFGGQALAEDLSLLLGLLADGLRRPVFPVEQIELLRDQLMVGLAIRAQDTASMAQLAFDELVYAGHPYRRPEDGYPETIQAIRHGDLADFWRKHYGPRGLVIAVVGAIDPLKVVDQVASALGDWQNPEQPAPPDVPAVRPLAGLVRRTVEIPGKSQTDLVMGVAGPERCAQQFMAANLGNSILGQFGLMGRVGEVVREASGLAYTVQSNLSGGLGPGPWDISAGVDPQHVEQAIELIRSEIRRFVSEPVSDEELADNQAYFIGSLPLSLEANHGVAGALLNMERYQLGLDYYQRYPALIRSITRDDILQAARRYLDPDRLAIAVAGPCGD